MILSDGDIKAALGSGRLKIDPLPNPKDVQPASLDIHLGNDFLVLKTPYSKHSELDTRKRNDDAFQPEIASVNGILIPSYGLVLGKVAEYLELPDDIACQVGGKSSIGRLGLSVHVTAGFVDPGWRGNLTLELSNVTSWPIRVYPGDKIAQLEFITLSSPASSAYSGKYQGAETVEGSKSYKDMY